jgi:hypothetical protein
MTTRGMMILRLSTSTTTKVTQEAGVAQRAAAAATVAVIGIDHDGAHSNNSI